MKTVRLKKQAGEWTTDVPLAGLFSTLRNGEYEIIIKRKSEKRTIAQNDLMWLWLTCLEQETGTSKDDCYLFFCKQFLTRWVCVNGVSEKVFDTSSKLTTKRMATFLDNIQAFASSELGITLPNPDDMYFEQFYQQFRR